MPYTVRKGGGGKPWKIVHATTGKTVASSTSKKNAQASARIRNASHR